MHNWWLFKTVVTQSSQSGTSGTFQQTTTSSLGHLHVLVSDKMLRVERGNGSSVSATSKMLWPAGLPYYFTPCRDSDALGWLSQDGTSANVTVGRIA